MIRHSVEDLVRSLATPAGTPLAGPAAGPAPPKAVAVVHFGPNGVSVATTGKASYAPLNSGGLSVNYDSALAGGTPASSSGVSIDQQGKPQSSTTKMLAADGSPTGTVTGAYGGLTLTAAGTPQSGAAEMAVATPQGQQTHAATMNYPAETFAAYALTALDAKGAVQSRTAVDYAKAEMAGTRLIGGSLAIQHSDPSGRPLSQAQSNLNRQGVPDTVLGTNFEADGKTPKLKLLSSYAGVAFNPLRKIQSGKLLVTSETPDGRVKAQTVFTFDRGKLVNQTQLESDEIIPPIPHEVTIAVPGPWTAPRPADKTAEVKRADGTLIEPRQDWFVAPGTTGTPRRSVVTLYATDGKTVIRITDIDYSGVTFDTSGNPAKGSVVSTQFQAGVRASITHVTY